MSIQEDIAKVIQKASLDGALTSQALEHYNGLVKDVARLEKSEGALEKEVSDLEKWKANHQEIESDLTKALAEWKNRESELIEREKKALTLELSAEHHAARLTDYREMMKTIFRNTQIRDRVLTEEEVRYTDQYGSRMTDYQPNRTTVTTERETT